MADIPNNISTNEQHKEERPGLKVLIWLVKGKSTSGIKSPHLWILVVFTIVFTYFYYFVLSPFQDIYVIIVFYPLIYAAIIYRLRGVLVSGIVFFLIVVPQAIMINDIVSLIRILLFGAFAFLISSLSATLLNYLEIQMEAYAEIQALNKELNSYIEQLENTQRQRVHVEKLKAIGQMAASMAHEINNPLSGALVYTKLLLKKLRSGMLNKEEAASELQKIDSAVSYSSQIIRNLLDFSRRTEPSLRTVTINKVLEQVLLLIGYQAVKKKINVIRNEDPNLPQVYADYGQLQQVLINLIVNAIQAMETGGTLTITTSLTPDKWITISVQDTGIGIPPENMEKLFTPFFSTKDVKGVGLGLAISYGIIERHGGKILVESEVSKGSIFTVYLPPYNGENRETNSIE
jgi:signal transduction histidine kinase